MQRNKATGADGWPVEIWAARRSREFGQRFTDKFSMVCVLFASAPMMSRLLHLPFLLKTGTVGEEFSHYRKISVMSESRLKSEKLVSAVMRTTYGTGLKDHCCIKKRKSTMSRILLVFGIMPHCIVTNLRTICMTLPDYKMRFDTIKIALPNNTLHVAGVDQVVQDCMLVVSQSTRAQVESFGRVSMPIKFDARICQGGVLASSAYMELGACDAIEGCAGRGGGSDFSWTTRLSPRLC